MAVKSFSQLLDEASQELLEGVITPISNQNARRGVLLIEVYDLLHSSLLEKCIYCDGKEQMRRRGRFHNSNCILVRISNALTWQV